jgi:pimeloyl-ACP methyl ester carboxylesterase
MTSEFWSPQIKELSQHYDVIAYDLLGHGGSPLPPPAPTLADYARQLIALLDALAIPRAHIVGHSMGALVVLETALAFPDRIACVTAMNGVYCRTPEQKAAALARAAALDRPAASVAPTLARWFGDPVPPRQQSAADLCARLLASADPVGYARTYRLFASSDEAHAGRLTALTCPALFITGETDPNSTPAMSVAMAAAAPRGRAIIVPGERHMMSLAAPDRITPHLTEFLAAVDSGQLKGL